MTDDRSNPGGFTGDPASHGQPWPEDRTRAADDAHFTEHLARAADAFMREMRDLVPDDVKQRARSSLRDALTSARNVIDSGIDRLNRNDER